MLSNGWKGGFKPKQGVLKMKEQKFKNYPYIRTERRCWKCKEVKPIEDFCKEKNKPGGYTYICKICNRLNRHRKNYSNEYYAKHKKEWRKKYIEKCI